MEKSAVDFPYETIFMAVANPMYASIGSATLALPIWLNEKGSKQYSDMPPPTFFPAKRIFKMPDTFSVPQGGINISNMADIDTIPNNNRTPPTLTDQNTAFKKRQNDPAAKDKKLLKMPKISLIKPETATTLVPINAHLNLVSA
ncbi:MAG: hypothetical protein H7240_06225 [Glaciimonas sp.]|nr:hypothetical protein [Glaciimonas sp.]